MGKMEKELRVLHIDTQMSWRGGQQQAYYLHKSLITLGIKSLMLCQPNSEMALKCHNENTPHFIVKISNEVDLIAVFKILKLINQHKFNIIHCHSAHALTIGIILKIMLRHLVLIGSRRVDFPIRKHLLSTFKYSTPLVDKIVCISENIKQVMLDSGIHESKLEMIHSGIDINKFENMKDCPVPEEIKEFIGKRKIIGTIAALVGHKDYPTLLRAARLVIDKDDDCVFIAVGDGRDKEMLLNLKKDLYLGNDFIFTGYKSNVKDYLAYFDIFVLSSKLEGLGTSVLDAMSAGIPVVACSSGGIPEMIVHQENGLLAETENPEDLAEKLEYALHNHDIMQTYALKSKEIVQKFSIERTVEHNIKLYKRLLNE